MSTPFHTRVHQLVLLLSSNQAGEVTAAAAALHRTLAAAGIDIHSFAKSVEAGLPVTSPTPAKRTTITARRYDGRPLKTGEDIICDEPDGLFRPCGCGSIIFSVGPPVGPHAGQLICNGCFRGGRWLRRTYFTGAPDAS
jgi:hypothetical protein